MLTQIEINWNGGSEAPEIYPVAPPDLFAEQPLVLFGRKQDAVAGELQVNGIAAGGEIYQQTFPVNLAQGGNVAVAQIWGRQKIKHLTNQMFDYEKKSMVKAVTETALSYQLFSEYTAFVAVSDEVRVEPDGKRVSVEVPVEMPQGVSYQVFFGAAPEQNLGDLRGRGGVGNQLFSPGVARSPQYTNQLGSPARALAFDAMDLASDSAPQVTDWVEQVRERRISDIQTLTSRFIKQGKQQETVSTKEVRMRHNFSDNDYQVRLSHIERFLKANHKVLVTITVNSHKAPTPNQGEQLLKRIATDLNEVADVEETPKVVGKIMGMVLCAKQTESVNVTDTPLQIIQVTGLDAVGQENLKQHLQNVNFPDDVSGEMVLELLVKSDRVVGVVLDDEVSTLKDKNVVEEIKRSLLKWRIPSGVTNKITIALQISS